MESFDPNEPSKGLGDTIAKITHALGIDKLAQGVANLLGEEDCGCGRRREVLNNIMPYSTSTTQTVVEDQVKEVEELVRDPVTCRVTVDFRTGSPSGIVEYKVGEVLYVDKNHPLYNSLDTYVNIEYVKVIKNIEE